MKKLILTLSGLILIFAVQAVADIGGHSTLMRDDSSLCRSTLIKKNCAIKSNTHELEITDEAIKLKTLPDKEGKSKEEYQMPFPLPREGTDWVGVWQTELNGVQFIEMLIWEEKEVGVQNPCYWNVYMWKDHRIVPIIDMQIVHVRTILPQDIPNSDVSTKQILGPRNDYGVMQEGGKYFWFNDVKGTEAKDRQKNEIDFNLIK